MSGRGPSARPQPGLQVSATNRWLRPPRGSAAQEDPSSQEPERWQPSLPVTAARSPQGPPLPQAGQAVSGMCDPPNQGRDPAMLTPCGLGLGGWRLPRDPWGFRPRPARPPTLTSAASPAAGSGCPMLDLVEPTSRGSLRLAHRARAMPFSSWGSPTWGGHGSGCLAAQAWGAHGVRAGLTLVPVPWASMYSREAGSIPADGYRERMSCSWLSPEGYVTPAGGRPQHPACRHPAVAPHPLQPAHLAP